MAENKVVRSKLERSSAESSSRPSRHSSLPSVLGTGTRRRAAADPPGAECLACHGDKSMTTTRAGKTVSLYVDGKKFATSVHGSFGCTGCHADLAGKDLPHDTPAPVKCGTCHSTEQEQHARSLHGKAIARGDPLAPRCVNCHGNHDIYPVKDPRSAVAPLKVPFVCGQCHREGTPVSRNRTIAQDNILENYSESIHGEALLKKGLSVAPNCATCHTPHLILPHTDPASSINRKNIAATCTKCHSQIETVHRKIIRGALWEKQANVLPACVDCHQPHKIRNVFYSQGMADADCMRCHADEKLLRARDGQSMYVSVGEVSHSRHNKIACSQCHSEVNASRVRPCETITQGVDCTSCHEEIGKQYMASIHGQLNGKNDPNAPDLQGMPRHPCNPWQTGPAVTDVFRPMFPGFARGVTARARRPRCAIPGLQHEIIANYTESIHGTIAEEWADGDGDLHQLPHRSPASFPEPIRNRVSTPTTCRPRAAGATTASRSSSRTASTAKRVSGYSKPLPVCNDCHTAHAIRRTDENSFRLNVMDTCGRCHAEIAKTYFDTYHGKVSRLGYTKAAKCYDCHGAHDVLAVADPRSHLSRANVAATCEKCHAGATRRFAGYLTHATHHDPRKYPFLFYTFWGMTLLLLGTFVVGGLHTLLWLPRAFQMRRELRAAEAEGRRGA